MKKIILAGFVASLAFSGVALAQTTTVIVPGEVKTYVLQQTSPSVTYDGTVVVGDTVEVYPIPQQPTYGYVVVNQQRVLVDPQSRRVIEVLQ
ncbi:DUF1236 domain-containing protein [Ensifer adhaerens]|uniref:DUF1236 domain-containing protein n=1 Tax=Ensifer adhaerens TaxID=106592 RepID=UPI001C4DEED4|nr:DUF1236 domain-containing protein [Ensifer adhaerens]MBW0365027.1 DUF1236 domain-containing protein [Ensifer adhaerens]UCM20643.1 DUF1236 domain-containing protein [Ensifer adhaerens]